MGINAYNRGTRAIQDRITREIQEKHTANIRVPCFCGVSFVGEWTAGTHHGARKCALVITDFEGRFHP